jgi:Na+/melibiose symporter-like transporter
MGNHAVEPFGHSSGEHGKLKLREKIAYGLGDVGNNFYLICYGRLVQAFRQPI